MPHAPSDPLERLEGGYARRLLHVDLTELDFSVQAIPVETFELFLGAKGLGARLLVEHFPAGTDPLAPENPLILATGPFQGTSISSAGRAVVVTRSPLTGIFLDSYIGGELGHRLKGAGFDALILTGRAQRPTTVHLTPGGAEFESAEGSWGQGTRVTEGRLRRERPEAVVMSIGPAGEKQVRFASPISDYRRVAGRGGSGAVMGSKQLKAVTFQGEATVMPADRELYETGVARVNAAIRQERREGHPFYTYGTTQSPIFASDTDRLPTRNYTSAQFEGARKLSGEALHGQLDIAARACCKPCLVACEGQVKGRRRGEPGSERPEYETLGLLGSNLGVDDPQQVMVCNDLCNDLGLDTISTGGVIGFALECAQRGVLELPDQFAFGDPRAARELIPRIAAREGVGDLLAEGVREAAARLGGEAPRWAVHAKGLEVPAWDPRGKLTNAMAYCTADIGASHLREWTPTRRIPNEPAAPLMADLVVSQNTRTMRDCYILCTFAWEQTTEAGAAELFTALTGLEHGPRTRELAAQRIWALTRAFNNALGIDRRHDTLCHRLLNEPLPTGPAAGCTAFVSEGDHQECLDRYYELRGWDEQGRVPPELWRELGLGALARP